MGINFQSGILPKINFGFFLWQFSSVLCPVVSFPPQLFTRFVIYFLEKSHYVHVVVSSEILKWFRLTSHCHKLISNPRQFRGGWQLTNVPCKIFLHPNIFLWKSKHTTQNHFSVWFNLFIGRRFDHNCRSPSGEI